jgi:hypothetical protein
MPFQSISTGEGPYNYIVGPVGNFVSIQAAIDQAVADGYDLLGTTIGILAGTYTEDLVLAANINLIGTSGEEEVQIVGVHTPPSAGTFIATNIIFSSLTSVLLSAAVGTCDIKFYDCIFNCDAGYIADISNWTNNGSLVIESCYDIPFSSDGIILNNGATRLEIIGSTIGSGIVGATISGSTTIDSSHIQCISTFTGAACDALITGSTIKGTITIADPAKVKIFNSYISVGAVPCITDNSAQFVQLGNVVLDSSGGSVLDGVGTQLEIGEVVYMNVALISGTLTIVRSNECAAGNLRSYGNIDLPATENTGDGGIVKFDDDIFIHGMGTNNTFVGPEAGNLSLTVATAVDSTGIGYQALHDQTSGANNSALGSLALGHVLTGSNNLAIGYHAGSSYVGAESSNILLANTGTAAESNCIRIGVNGAGAGQQDKNYQAGIYQASSGATKELVWVDSNHKLSSSNVGFTSWTTATVSGNIAVNTGYVVKMAVPGLCTLTLPATAVLGDMVEIVGYSAAGFLIAQNANQSIRLGAVTSTIGVGGSVSPTLASDSIKMVCITAGASTEWVITYAVGAFTIV